MRNLIPTALVVFIVAIFLSACEKCEECSADLSSRFRFVDTTRVEILDDLSALQIVDLAGNPYPVERETTEADTFYIVDLRPLSMELESPDTVLLLYASALIDSVQVGYGFSSDSRCCTNTFNVNRLQFFKRDAARRILPEFYIYDVIIE